jgi:hypothetical protein
VLYSIGSVTDPVANVVRVAVPVAARYPDGFVMGVAPKKSRLPCA